MSSRDSSGETLTEKRLVVRDSQVLVKNPTMDDILARREPSRPRRVSAAAAAPEIGANVSLQDVEVLDVYPDRPSTAAGRKERWNSAPQMVHHRHMPMEPLKLPIPRKAKENRGVFPRVLFTIV